MIRWEDKESLLPFVIPLFLLSPAHAHALVLRLLLRLARSRSGTRSRALAQAPAQAHGVRSYDIYSKSY
jgi:hypothetical protein